MGQIFLTLTILWSMTMYIFDLGSDIALAVEHFVNGDYWWGGWTTAFIVAPLVVYFGASFVISPILLLFLNPLCFKCGALMNICSDEGEAKNINEYSVLLQFIEVVLEATPQSALQLYIVGKTNKCDLLQLLGITTSLFSLSLGMVNGVYEITKENTQCFDSTLLRGVVFKTVFLLWTLMQVVSFLPPLAFFTSRGNPALMAILIYFFVHSFVSVLCSFYFNKNKAKFSKFVSILLHLLLLFLTLYFSFIWFGSLTLFLPESSLSGFPMQIWNSTPVAWQDWIIRKYIGNLTAITANTAADTDVVMTTVTTIAAATASMTAVTENITVAAANMTAAAATNLAITAMVTATTANMTAIDTATSMATIAAAANVTATATNAHMANVTAIANITATAAAANMATTAFAANVTATATNFPTTATPDGWLTCDSINGNATSLFGQEFCLLDHASSLFGFFFLSSLVTFVYHCVFIAIWPTLKRKVFY